MKKIRVVFACSDRGIFLKSQVAHILSSSNQGTALALYQARCENNVMKRIYRTSLIPYLAILSALGMSVVLKATPYATSLTNDAGVVSFRLNQTTSTNDRVLVISSGGTVTNALQLPSADPANVLTRGLIQTNLGIPAGPFKVFIKHTGSGIISTNSPRIPFNSLRGIAANTRAASPYFGWVYVGNSAA